MLLLKCRLSDDKLHVYFISIKKGFKVNANLETKEKVAQKSTKDPPKITRLLFQEKVESGLSFIEMIFPH